MPPKSSSVALPCRSFKVTARKSALPVHSKRTSILKSSPSTPSFKDTPLTSPPTFVTSTSTTPPSLKFSWTQSGSSSSPDNKKTLQTKSSPDKSSPLASYSVGTREKAMTPVSPSKINVGDAGQEKILTTSSTLNDEVGIKPTNSIPVDGQEIKTRAADGALVGFTKAAVDADGARTVVEGGKRKVIKRVKVVKKVVKRVIRKVPKGSLESGEAERVPNVGNLNESTQNLETKLDVSESTEIENVVPICNDSVKNEKFEPIDTAALEVENEGPKEIKVDSVEVEMVGPFVESVSPMEISSEVPFADSNEGEEEEGIQNQIEDDKDSRDFVQDQNAVPVKEGAGEVEEVVKEFVENNGAGLSGRVALSEEMEAVERRRRRRTEIFLGGLVKDTKEEDIRKVFEQVGEVTEVRLVMDSKTGRNKGYAFVRFASAADARKALAKCSKVEICGKQCGAQPVEGNDTLYLGNINKKWKDDDVIRLLKDAGIEKIDKVTVKADPDNFEQNRGFAFLELETSKDAQIAYNKLKKNAVFNKQMKIKVAWAQPLVEPDEKVMPKGKSVFAEYLPSLWDEEKVKIFFKRFGEIESVTLAKNLPSSRRKDFAFVNYKSREAALACIEAFSHEQVDEDGSKVNVKVSLAKPQKKLNQMKHVSVSIGKELSKDKPKTPQPFLKVHKHRNMGIPPRRSHEVISDRTNSTSDELIHLLRQQAASRRPMQAGSSDLNYYHSSSGSKRTFHELGNYALSSDPRGFPRTHLESSHLTGNPSSFSNHVGRVPLPYSQQRNPGNSFESSHRIPDYPHFQMMEQPPFLGHSRIYRRYA